LLHSTFARLMFLGDVPGAPFEKLDERTAAGERIVTWRVRYGFSPVTNAGVQKIFDFLSASQPLNVKSMALRSTVAPGNFGVPESSLMLKQTCPRGWVLLTPPLLMGSQYSTALSACPVVPCTL